MCFLFLLHTNRIDLNAVLRYIQKLTKQQYPSITYIIHNAFGVQGMTYVYCSASENEWTKSITVTAGIAFDAE